MEVCVHLDNLMFRSLLLLFYFRDQLIFQMHGQEHLVLQLITLYLMFLREFYRRQVLSMDM